METGLNYINCTFVCLRVFCSVSKEGIEPTSTKCSPRWDVYPQQFSWDSDFIEEATTQRECLEYCVANSSCVAVEWDDLNACYVHYNSLDDVEFAYSRGYRTFELINRCNSTLGKIHDTVLLIIIIIVEISAVA